MSNNNVSDSNRDYLFDNIKALLIFLVVLGHMITEQMGEIVIIDAIYYFIYIFHMPAFIFISGYFSKDANKSRENAFRSLFIPYLVINTVFWFLNKFTLFEEPSPFRILDPVWGLWFYLSLFIWKLLLKDLVKIKYILPISFFIGIMSGFSEEFSSKMSLARILSFLPFFLLGYYCKKEHIDKIRKLPKSICTFVIVVYGIVAYYIVKLELFKKESFYMRKAFSRINQDIDVSFTARIFIYISAIIIIICLINLFSTKKKWYTMIGENSVTVYILHLIAVANLRKLSLPWDESVFYLIYAIIVSALITYICSRQIVVNGYKNIMNGITDLLLIKDKKMRKN